MRDAPSTQSLLQQRHDAIDQYKLLRDAYKKYAAAYVALVNNMCDLETDILTALVAEGEVADVHTEIKSAETWLASVGGDPPADSAGLGVLLSMINVDLPEQLDPPTDLIN